MYCSSDRENLIILESGKKKKEASKFTSQNTSKVIKGKELAVLGTSGVRFRGSY